MAGDDFAEVGDEEAVEVGSVAIGVGEATTEEDVPPLPSIVSMT